MSPAPHDAPCGVRVYLCGETAVECGDRVARGAALGRGQGRRLLARLATRRHDLLPRHAPIEALWDGEPPAAADTFLNAVVSRVRAALRGLGVPAPHGVATESDGYRLVVPGAWVDVEAARAALDEAEGALRQAAHDRAWAAANVAAAITARPFLPGEHATWIDGERERLAQAWRRASLVLARVSTAHGEHALAIQHATAVLDAEPFDERACRTLMRAHAAGGDRAGALRVYARSRARFRDELGVEPSEATMQVFLAILRADDAAACADSV